MKTKNKMPNYVKNKIEIECSNEQLNKVLNFLKTEEQVIDFNNIIQMPKSLSISSNSFISPLENQFQK